MAVLLNTSLGDIVIDLHVDQCPLTTKNFLKLCKIKYYNNCVFHTVQKDFIVQTGDPTGTGSGGDSVYRFLYGDQARFFSDEIHPDLKHNKVGTVAMASAGENLNASQFYVTTRADLEYLDGKHTVFGEVAEGLDTLMRINEAYVDERGRPFKNIRIKHTYVLDDPFDDPVQLFELILDKSPELKPPAEGEEVRLEDDWIPMDEQLNPDELENSLRQKEAHSRAVVLEMVGDIPEAEIKPPENVLFVCKLNPVTQEEDLEIIFSRFGKIRSADIIRDYKTGDSLCYAFIEFETQEACEAAYFKMDNVLIDDRRIHVDFSQSVAKLWTRYRRFGKKGNVDDEGTNFTPKVKGRVCFTCGENDHFARDCPKEASKETLQKQNEHKYKLKDMEGQHGGSTKRYEMVFEDRLDMEDKYPHTKEKDLRKPSRRTGSSEEERGRISGSLPSKRSGGDIRRSKEHSPGYSSKQARGERYVMNKEPKERKREEMHRHAVNPDDRHASGSSEGDRERTSGSHQSKRSRGETHGSKERHFPEYRYRESKGENYAMEEQQKEKDREERHRHARSKDRVDDDKRPRRTRK